MDQPLIALDESRRPARYGLPESAAPKNPELRIVSIIVTSAIFLLALVAVIWIIISLFGSKYAFDSLPIIGSGNEVKQLEP